MSSNQIVPIKAELTNNATNKVRFKVKEINEKSVFNGTYTANNGNIHLDHVRIRLTNTPNTAADLYNLGVGYANDASDVLFTIKIDGTPVATIDNPRYVASSAIRNADYANFSPITVESGKSVSVEVVANIYADHSTVQNLEYKILLSGDDDYGGDAGYAERAFAPIAFVENNPISLDTDPSMKIQDLVLANKNQNLARFIVKPANNSDYAELDKLVFTLDDNLKALVAKHVTLGLDEDDLFEVLIGGEKTNNLTLLNNNGTLAISDINKEIVDETEVQVKFKEKLELTSSTTTSAVDPVCKKRDLDVEPENDQIVDCSTDSSLYLYNITSPIPSVNDAIYVTTAKVDEKNTIDSVYTLTLIKVNENDNIGDTYTFKRLAVNSGLRVRSMSGDKHAETKYVFDVEYSDDANSETIKNVVFTYDGRTPSTETWINVQDGKTYSADNSRISDYNVTNITYVDGDGYEVNIDYNDYPDFFMVGGTRLKAYQDD